jgi:hypothetical protein
MGFADIGRSMLRPYGTNKLAFFAEALDVFGAFV